MSIIRVGSTKKYAEGWELIFGKSGQKKSRSRTSSAKSSRSNKKSPSRKRK